MNIGGRINLRLKELGWQRRDLLEKIPDLTSQALHNLIKRDSVRSEWDVVIAKALGVSVLWLVYNESTSTYQQDHPVLHVAESTQQVLSFPNRVTPLHPTIVRVIELMNNMDDVGKGMLCERAVVITEERASCKANSPGS